MNFENKQTHQTVFGGIVTILVSVGFFAYFLSSMLSPHLFYLKDTISTSSLKIDYNKQTSEMMYENGEQRFKMMFYMVDPTFDNDDNPYGKFVFHMYTNMDGPDDVNGTETGFNDIEVPIKNCNSKSYDWSVEEIRYYCTDFNDNHFLRGGFTGDKYSWMRLILHICDNSTEATAKRQEEK